MSRRESPEEARERQRREVLQEAGQACLDWAQDTGDCHLCSYDGGAGKLHDVQCPLRRLVAIDLGLVCPQCREPWHPQNETTCGPCGGYVPNGPVRG